jgi:hypothetical protein
LSEQAAKERRAKQTVNNLLLSLLATAGMVLMLVLVVPRDDSSRIPKVDYTAIAQQAATSSKQAIIAPELPEGWWSNKATWLANPVDAVPRFEAGFVGPKNQYIGMAQAFGVNPTWLALTLKDVVLEKNYSNAGSSVVWGVYKSPKVNTPPKTKDVIWIATVGADAVMIYGDGSVAEFEAFTKAIESKLGAK